MGHRGGLRGVVTGGMSPADYTFARHTLTGTHLGMVGWFGGQGPAGHTRLP